MSLVILAVKRNHRGALVDAQIGAFDAHGALKAMQTVPAFLIPIENHGTIRKGDAIAGELEFSFKTSNKISKEDSNSHFNFNHDLEIPHITINYETVS